MLTSFHFKLEELFTGFSDFTPNLIKPVSQPLVFSGIMKSSREEFPDFFSKHDYQRE